jgi:hypothetical protein
MPPEWLDLIFGKISRCYHIADVVEAVVGGVIFGKILFGI